MDKTLHMSLLERGPLYFFDHGSNTLDTILQDRLPEWDTSHHHQRTSSLFVHTLQFSITLTGGLDFVCEDSALSIIYHEEEVTPHFRSNVSIELIGTLITGHQGSPIYPSSLTKFAHFALGFPLVWRLHILLHIKVLSYSYLLKPHACLSDICA